LVYKGFGEENLKRQTLSNDMEKSKKFALILLRYLEKIFPQDMATSHKDTLKYVGAFDRKVIETLIENKLIEEKEYTIRGEGLPKDTPKLFVPKITSKGIEFLNGLRQKRTNILLLILTILLSLMGIAQILILVMNKSI